MDLSKTRLNGDGAVSVPPEEPRVLSLLPRRSALVPVAPRRTICNRTPHCRAAPQTICLRCVAKKRRRVKSKTFLALKRSAPVQEARGAGGAEAADAPGAAGGYSCAGLRAGF